MEIEASGKKILILTEGPFPGFIKLLVDPETGSLILDGGQEHHEFIRSSGKLKVMNKDKNKSTSF